MKNLHLFISISLFIIISFSNCKKDPSPKDDRLRESGIFPSRSYELPPPWGIVCSEKDTLNIEVLDEETVKIRGKNLMYEGWLETTEAHRYFTNNGSNIHAYTLLYYPCGERILYSEAQTWDGYSTNWEGGRLGRTLCPSEENVLPVANCKAGPTNRICLNADNTAATFSYGTIRYSTSDNISTAFVQLFSPDFEIDTLTGSIQGEGDLLSFSVVLSDSTTLEAGTYASSDFLGSTVYLGYDLNGPPDTYLDTSLGEVIVSKEEDEFVLQMEIDFCEEVKATGYFKGVLRE